MDRVLFRGWGKAGLLCLVLALCGLLLVGCDSGTPTGGATPTPSVDPNDLGVIDAMTPTPVPSPTGLSDDDRVSVYVSVIQEMLSKEGKEVTHVYISPYIGQGEHLDNPDVDTPVPDKLLAALKSADKSKTRIYNTTDFSEATGAFEDGAKVKNGGVFITLGPITNEGGNTDSVSLRASIYREATSAEGNIYSLDRDPASDTGWKLVTTAPDWSSEDQP